MSSFAPHARELPEAPLPRNTESSAAALELVHLKQLMERTSGRTDVKIGLIDGPVSRNHPDLPTPNIQEIPGRVHASCSRIASSACIHGTFVAGILAAKRGSGAPAIAPDCTLLVRPIFAEGLAQNGDMPSATPEELATAIIDTVEAGARVLNLSAALVPGSPKGELRLGEALDYAARRGVIVVAAAGNQGTVGSSTITRHPWVIPVVACDASGRPSALSNLGNSIGRQGLSAPGELISSLGTTGKAETFGGTSAAAPFVTGAIALLCSEFPTASAAEIKLATTDRGSSRRNTLVPPLLNAWAAYQAVAFVHGRRKAS
jgi:subtilisin family serine protease